MGNTVEKEEIIIRCSAQEMVKNFVKDYEIIWHDPNINTPENLQYIAQFNSFCQVRTFTDWKEAATYTAQANTACHLITSGTNGESLVKEVHQISNVSKIYVFCGNKAFHQTWAKNYSKIICVENNIKILVLQIEQNMLQWQRQTSSLRVGLPAFAPIFDDMDKSDMNYLHLNLKGLANFKNRQQAKEDFLALSKVIFPDKANISKFESSYKKYDMKQILRWYTKESFLYKVANNCLRIATSDAIQYCRLILKDLETAIREQYQLKSKLFSGLLYRGAYISEKEWANILSNMGKDIEMYGFLSTSKSKIKAEEFVLSDHERKVLITIIVPQGPDKGEQGFAEVREFSYFPAEEEILFNVRSRFTILEATEEESSEKKFRHLVLLYGAQEWRKNNFLTKPVHRILMEQKQQATCIGCKSQISGTLGGFYYISMQENKRESVCEQCLEGYLTINKGPLLYVQQGKGGILHQNGQRVYEVKGVMMRYPIMLNIPLYGYHCSRCETRKSKWFYKCVECPKNENLWCQYCFKGGEECSEKGHNIILETQPFSFWSEEMTEQEFKHLNFQEEMITKDSVFQQADIFFKSNQYEKAMQYYTKFIEGVKPDTNQDDLATSYQNLGMVYTNIGKYEEALENFFKALEIIRTIYGQKHADIAMLYNNIGLAYDSMENHEEALKFYFMSLELYKVLHGENHQDVAMLYNNIGLVFDSLGKSELALEYHFKGIEIKKTVYGENHPTVGTSYNNIGLTYDNLGKNKEALDNYFKALEIKKAVYGEKHADIIMLYNNIGWVYGGLKKYPKALKHHLKALELKKLIHGENHPSTAQAYNNIAHDYEGQGKNEEALKYFSKSLEISRASYGENHQDVATSYYNIGKVLKEMGQFEKSLGNLEKACEIRKGLLGEKHASVVQISRVIEQVNAKINKKNKKNKGAKGGPKMTASSTTPDMTVSSTSTQNNDSSP